MACLQQRTTKQCIKNLLLLFHLLWIAAVVVTTAEVEHVPIRVCFVQRADSCNSKRGGVCASGGKGTRGEGSIIFKNRKIVANDIVNSKHNNCDPTVLSRTRKMNRKRNGGRWGAGRAPLQFRCDLCAGRHFVDVRVYDHLCTSRHTILNKKRARNPIINNIIL